MASIRERLGRPFDPIELPDSGQERRRVACRSLEVLILSPWDHGTGAIPLGGIWFDRDGLLG